MNRIARATIAGTTAALALTLTGCFGGDDEGGKASGLRDDVKHTAYKAGKPAKTHTKTTTGTKRQCTGTGTKRVCTTVPDVKTETVTDRPAVPAKPAKWCVELDDVNGNQDDDDQWFTVTSGVYADQVTKNEGAKVTDMKYLHKGC